MGNINTGDVVVSKLDKEKKYGVVFTTNHTDIYPIGVRYIDGHGIATDEANLEKVIFEPIEI